MFKPLSLFIGLRYTRAKKRNHFISFISLISMLGIALGVLVLITVLSVMNGFDYQIKNRILDMVPQVTVSSWAGQLNQKATFNGEPLNQFLAQAQGVTATAPYIQGQAMLTNEGITAFGVVEGVDPKREGSVSPIVHKFTQGHIADLKAGQFGIVLGADLAGRLGVNVGSTVTLVVPKANVSPFGFMPVLKQFKVVGLFKVGYQYDQSYALINIQDAQRLFNMPHHYTGWQLKLKDLFLAPQVAHDLTKTLGFGYQALDWTQQNPNFFKALKMEKMMMFLILMLLVAVAAFNMLASLVMVVTDKQSEIAILRTIGCKSQTIMRIFIVQGMTIGVMGTLIGVVLGVLLALNVTDIVNHIQNWLGVQFLSSSVYYIDFLPSRLQVSDVVVITVIALLMSFLATLYPAWRASQIQPAEALRYE